MSARGKDLPQHVAVLIPARNEEALLARCLRSVFVAASNLPHDVTCDIVVAVDRSTDGTFALAEAMLQGWGTVVRLDAGSVGRARAAAAELALARYSGDRRSCWIANTDADCCVPADWLCEQLALASAGLDAIAGVVDVDSFEEHEGHVAGRFRATYLLHADGTHPHVHGANLGVRASAYLKAGGWSSLETAEDHDLWGRLQRSGARCASLSRVTVLTSGRRAGRAPQGFAAALAAHNGLRGDDAGRAAA